MWKDSLMGFYRVMAVPTLLYGSKVWILTVNVSWLQRWNFASTDRIVHSIPVNYAYNNGSRKYFSCFKKMSQVHVTSASLRASQVWYPSLRVQTDIYIKCHSQWIVYILGENPDSFMTASYRIRWLLWVNMTIMPHWLHGNRIDQVFPVGTRSLRSIFVFTPTVKYERFRNFNYDVFLGYFIDFENKIIELLQSVRCFRGQHFGFFIYDVLYEASSPRNRILTCAFEFYVIFWPITILLISYNNITSYNSTIKRWCKN